MRKEDIHVLRNNTIDVAYIRNKNILKGHYFSNNNTIKTSVLMSNKCNQFFVQFTRR